MSDIFDGLDVSNATGWIFSYRRFGAGNVLQDLRNGVGVHFFHPFELVKNNLKLTMGHAFISQSFMQILMQHFCKMAQIANIAAVVLSGCSHKVHHLFSAVLILASAELKRRGLKAADGDFIEVEQFSQLFIKLANCIFFIFKETFELEDLLYCTFACWLFRSGARLLQTVPVLFKDLLRLLFFGPLLALGHYSRFWKRVPCPYRLSFPLQFFNDFFKDFFIPSCRFISCNKPINDGHFLFDFGFRDEMFVAIFEGGLLTHLDDFSAIVGELLDYCLIAGLGEDLNSGKFIEEHTDVLLNGVALIGCGLHSNY
jgi:hypothetical protein